MKTTFDVVIAGAGPAGLSAALYLARAEKSVLLVDHGTPRNAAARHAHGFLTREGVPPAELRAAARADLVAFPHVSFGDDRVASIERMGAELRVTLASGGHVHARRVLIATGLVDRLPAIPGLKECWGQSAFSCPYCHGHEHARGAWGVLAIQRAVVKNLALFGTWTRDLVLFANGRTDLGDEVLTDLARRHIRVEPRKIAALIHEGGVLSAIELEDGERVARTALVLHPPQRQTDLVLFAGLALDEEGLVKIDDAHESSMRGVFVAGDAADGHPQAIIAAAGGAQAAMGIIESLAVEDARSAGGS